MPNTRAVNSWAVARCTIVTAVTSASSVVAPATPATTIVGTNQGQTASRPTDPANGPTASCSKVAGRRRPARTFDDSTASRAPAEMAALTGPTSQGPDPTASARSTFATTTKPYRKLPSAATVIGRRIAGTRRTAGAPARNSDQPPSIGAVRSGPASRTRLASRPATTNSPPATDVPVAGPPPSIRARPRTPGPAIQVRLTTPVSRAFAAGSVSSGTLCTVAAASAG